MSLIDRNQRLFVQLRPVGKGIRQPLCGGLKTHGAGGGFPHLTELPHQYLQWGQVEILQDEHVTEKEKEGKDAVSEHLVPHSGRQGSWHSDVKTTLQLYAHSISEDRMAAQGQVLEAILKSSSTAVN
jgi:hypothetical protein